MTHVVGEWGNSAHGWGQIRNYIKILRVVMMLHQQITRLGIDSVKRPGLGFHGLTQKNFKKIKKFIFHMNFF